MSGPRWQIQARSFNPADRPNRSRGRAVDELSPCIRNLRTPAQASDRRATNNGQIRDSKSGISCGIIEIDLKLFPGRREPADR